MNSDLIGSVAVVDRALGSQMLEPFFEEADEEVDNARRIVEAADLPVIGARGRLAA